MGTVRNSVRSFNLKYDNDFSYLCFKYHFHFFQSLISRGRKLWAFSFFVKVKYNLKKFEKIDPFVVFIGAVTNVAPEVLLFPLRFAGVVHQVGLPISTKKQIVYSTK